ncbi:MAG: hypothetical protein JSV91_07540, partial [Phycisphaerales bacterium]
MRHDNGVSLFLRGVLLTACLIGSTLMTCRQSPAATLEDYTKWYDWADGEIGKIIAVPDSERTYENTLGALDDVIARVIMETQFPVVLSVLSPDAEERAIGNQVEAALDEWAIKLGKNEELYRAVKAYADTKPPLT